MYGNTYYNPGLSIDRLTRQKEEIDNLIKTYQTMGTQTPINNFINTGQTNKDDLYVLKKLNTGDEVENILVPSDTIFIGTGRMQIKKVDGTIEKYTIEKYYPFDEKDEKIKELNKKVEEFERKLNNESVKYSSTTKEFNKSSTNDDGDVEFKPKTSGKSIPK